MSEVEKYEISSERVKHVLKFSGGTAGFVNDLRITQREELWIFRVKNMENLGALIYSII